MLPHTTEAWIFITVACVAGFVIGQWLKSRRQKAEKNDRYLDGLKERILAENRARTKKERKKRSKTKQ